MIKKLITFILICCSFSAFAQNKETLFYFTDNAKDKIGVKDQNGNIIIPAEFLNYSGTEDGTVVEDTLLSFVGCPKNIKQEPHTFGCVFNRKGEYLYQTFWYDNGADYRVEGYQRIVKNGKIGFANREGEIVIQPQFDFSSPFNYGYASVCDGCYWKKAGEDHKTVVDGKWGFINKKGEKVAPLSKPIQEKDVKIHENYYPYPFNYSEKEQKILNVFQQKMKLLADIYYVNVYSLAKPKVLHFEIVERPSKYFPFYLVYSYDNRKIPTDGEFLVSQDGKSIFAVAYSGKKIPFAQWLQKQIQAAREYQQKHSDNPNKFIE
ncbi:WG repeat-containing protein [Phocoenobacter atlanticus]|uniref:WG repeat-containing protein n=1 Tax=Phocoenobacter atlanticus TaxID=3416742 RepID=UPI0027491326|nr:WG repeat-containing protein [Pasteurella atlantica]MDP8100840.1 WG repeat-containing protein [Pasteurella atlantica]